MPPSVRCLSTAVILLAACTHTEPFGSSPEGAEGPFEPGDPAVLTLNPLRDLRPTWLPDGSGILYTFEGSPAVNGDQCLGQLPAGGGTRTREICNTSAGHLDSTEVYGSPAVSQGGRLAYSYEQSTPQRFPPNVRQLRVATLADPLDVTVVHTLSLDVEGTKVDGIGDLHWLSETRLVYLAQSINAIFPPGGGPPAIVIDGLAVVVVDLVNDPAPAIVPGTQTATSVALGDAPEVILYTLAGDSRVYRRELATGADTVLHDFGTLGIARDAALLDDRLVAVVGGAVIFQIDPVGQVDLGGRLFVVDLATGQTAPLAGGSTTYLFRHPSIGPTGAVVAEGFLFATVTGGGLAVSPLSDLLLYEAP